MSSSNQYLGHCLCHRVPLYQEPPVLGSLGFWLWQYQVAWLRVINPVCTTFEIMQKLFKLKNIINTQKTIAGVLHMFS